METEHDPLTTIPPRQGKAYSLENDSCSVGLTTAFKDGLFRYARLRVGTHILSELHFFKDAKLIEGFKTYTPPSFAVEIRDRQTFVSFIRFLHDVTGKCLADMGEKAE